MKKKLANTNNLMELAKAFSILADDSTAEPHMGLIHGFTGSGKTTSIAWLLNRLPDLSPTGKIAYKGVYVRAMAVWNAGVMLRTILGELGIEAAHSNAKNMAMLCDRLQEGHALFIDEADYLFDGRDKRMLETLRDAHDSTGMPIVFIGMDGIERKLGNSKQLDRRVTQRVRFNALDLKDAQQVADTCCEVEIDPELVERLHVWAKGSIAMLVIGLTEIERTAKLQRLEQIDSGFWGDKPFRRG